MSPGDSTEQRVRTVLWPWVEGVRQSWGVPGLAVAVVHDGDQVVAQGFGARHRGADAPVGDETLFHLASVSKPFVATAALQLVESGELDLDTGITTYLPDLRWADPRAPAVTLRHLLSHRSGLGDVTDYGWHEPELDEGALARFAAVVAGWSLEHDPGTRFAYSNAGYELVGHLLARRSGRSFEALLRERVLDPAGMTTSTFRRDEVPEDLGADPHLGLPERVVPGAYPYTRRHAPSSTLHSSARELGRWMSCQLSGGSPLLGPAAHASLWHPLADTGESGWHEQVALGWFRGTYRGHRLVGHSGDDPGFQANLALLPELGLGVAVLVNANTAPVFGLTRAALDVLLDREPDRPPLPPVTVPLGPVLEQSGVAVAADLYHRLSAAEPHAFDLDDEGFEDAVWGVIEMHRTDLAWPLLELWLRVQPGSAAAWFQTGWAHAVDSRRDEAVAHLRRALEIDPGHEEATTLLRRLLEGR